MKVLVLDNYDSFTYNLVYLLRQMDLELEVHRNDRITPEQALAFQTIILSPGPGIPSEAGNMPDIIAKCVGQVPILGICLGHQAIAEFVGASLINRSLVLHGVQHEMEITAPESALFKGLNNKLLVGRYHSWEVDKKSLPDSMNVTAIDDQGCVLAMEDLERKLYGLQFHPESIMTPEGPAMVRNFIHSCQLKAI